jgi:hypothetical protein
MKAFTLFLFSMISLSAKANPEALAKELFEASPGFPANQADVQKSISEQAPGYSGTELKEMQDVSSMFDDNVDTGKREGDSIRSNLSKRVNEHNKSHQDKNGSALGISEVEGLFLKKHNYKLSETDSVFMGHKSVQEEYKIEADSITDNGKTKFGAHFSNRTSQDEKEAQEKIMTCREAGLGTVEPCTKQLILKAVPQDPIVKTVTAYFTAQCYNLVTFSVNLKTGKIGVSQCENKHHENTSVDNPIGEPDYPDKTTVELISQRDVGEGGVRFSRDLHPSHHNGFSGSFTAFQPKTGRKKSEEGNKNRVRGGSYTWKITMPRKPKLVASWEGCEDLERKTEEGACTLGENTPTGVQESRHVEGYPDLVKQDFWAEERSYLCGFGSNKNECQSLEQQGCEQIDSKCAIEKGNHCIEHEKTFNCAMNDFHSSSQVPSVNTLDFNLSKIQPGFEGYSTADFGSALAHFNAVKEMSADMKDGLGGIGGSAENPTIFHGKCDKCTIKGGRWIQDCCNLKGVLQGVLGGGCRESEKLATAVFREKRCHLLQKKYCTHKLKLGVAKVCVEWKDAYCCYGSEMARIIQEIAHDDSEQTALRAYNAAHGIDSGWGTGENPNCRSLSAEQLSLVNFDTPFAQKHLGQLFKTFEGQATEKLQNAQNKANSDEGMKARAEKAAESMKAHFSSTAKDRPIRQPGQERK